MKSKINMHEDLDVYRLAFDAAIDIFVYIDETRYSEYLEIAEDLSLQIMDVVTKAGSSFAIPSQTTYLENGEGIDNSQTNP